jgi:hypothetical protein
LPTHGRRRIPIDDVWGVLLRVEPQTVASTAAGATLIRVLEELAADGRLRLGGRRTRGLPSFVELPRAEAAVTRTRGPSIGPLHPLLAAAREDIAPGWTDTEVEVIQRVNRWLVEEDGVGARPVALRERSWALFGDDKLLEGLRRMFDRGVLSEAILRVQRTPPPFPWIAVGDAPAMLFVENSATFDSIVRVLEGASNPRYGLVAFAGGLGFADRLPFLRRVPLLAHRPAPQVLHYFGDVDGVGLDIPRVAAEAARRLGLPALEPAGDLYQALLNLSGIDCPEVSGHRLAGWLPVPLESWALAVIEARDALPQEALDREALRRLLC